MKAKIIIPFCLALAGCAESEPTENGTASKELLANSVSPTATVLSNEDMVRVCRGGISFRNGTANARLKVGDVSDGIVRLSYTRDDGKFFTYDCKLEGNMVRFRMIDEAGPGTGPGTWSGKGSTTTFEIFPDAIEFQDQYMDGSNSKERVKI